MATTAPAGVRQVADVSADYTADPKDYLILVDTSDAPITVTLPSAGRSLPFGKKIVDVGGNAATNNITVDTEGSEQIRKEGSAANSQALSTDDGSWEFEAQDTDADWVMETASTGTHASTHHEDGDDELQVEDLATASTTTGAVPQAGGAGGLAMGRIDHDSDIDNISAGDHRSNEQVRDLAGGMAGTDLTHDDAGDAINLTNRLLASALVNDEVLADDGNLYSTVQDAENAASSWIFVPPATFTENVVIDTARLVVIGAGRDTLIDGQTGHAIDIRASDVVIRDLSVQTTGGGGNTADGIHNGNTNPAVDVRLDNVWVRDSDRHGVFADSDRMWVEGVTVESADGDGVNVGSNATDVLIRGCDPTSASGSAISDSGTGTQRSANADGVTTTEALTNAAVSKGSTTDLYSGTAADDAGFENRVQPTDGVSTSATTIFSITGGEINSIHILVSGDERADNSRFAEVVHASPAGSNIDVVNSQTTNTPDGRTYSWNGNNEIQLAMAANTYDVVAVGYLTRRDTNATS